jgi:putative membrane protein
VALLAHILVAFVAIEHLGFLVLEMFLWSRPVGLRVFGQTQAQADGSAKLAANQGLYNGFLAAGLLVSLVATDPVGHALAVFSLCCVVAAGVFGGYTVKKSILVVQALPAAIALVLLTL